jgi:hypothetical protein
MPNHVANVISFNNVDKNLLIEILEQIKNDEEEIGSIDFNKIMPMPKSLEIESGSRTTTGIKAYKDFLDVYLFDRKKPSGLDLFNIPESNEIAFLKQRTDIAEDIFKLGKSALQNVQKYSCPTWYEWSIEKWGTKWNAYDSCGYDEGSNSIEFSTAWSAPHPILQKLSEMYPDIEIEHKWADEDLGFNTGEIHYKGGEVTFENVPDGGSKEAYELAADVQGVDLEESFRLSEDGTTYEYVNDEELSLS